MRSMNMKHNCDLDIGSDSMLPEKCRYRGLRKLGQISPKHPLTQYHYRSYPAMVAARQKHLLEEGCHTIHPLSLFSLVWSTFMIFVNISHILVAPFRMVYIVVKLENLKHHVLDYILLILHLICMLDIVVLFNTGYIKSVGNIVMSRKLVARRYLRRWFVLDAISCAPVAFIMLGCERVSPRCVLVTHGLAVIRALRLHTVRKDLKTFIMLFTNSYIWHNLVRLAIFFFTTLHLCTCALSSTRVCYYYWYGEINFRSNMSRAMLEQHPYVLYSKALRMALSAFFGTVFTHYQTDSAHEIAIQAIVIVYAALFMIYTVVFFIKLYLTIFGSTIKYHEVMSQVEAYMRLKQFPKSLKRRVRAFYQFRYQNQHFGEDDIWKYLSDDLAIEICLHTRHQLIDKTRLFDGIPVELVGSVLGCLRPEVYLSNDLIVSAGDIGDCMYFIANGTVAVYSLKGIEVCHLEDGAHFGEVALLMMDRKRVATVVAVEITTLYRLDAADFGQHVCSNPTLSARLQQLASRRMHETVVLDEAFQRDSLAPHPPTPPPSHTPTTRI